VTMNDRFVYDEKTSRLFAPDGTLLKKIFCPKATRWNQLLADDDADRSRGCPECGHRVLNLDTLSTGEVLSAFSAQDEAPCVFASAGSDRVVFLRDRRAVPAATERATAADGGVLIRTARSLAGINRAARMGYWPDLRFVEYKTRILKTKMALGQHKETGQVEILGDYRGGFGDPFVEVHPFTFYYPYYQRIPIAAYLIPRDLPDLARIVAVDPIEDHVGSTWNQGSSYRATHVPGFVQDRRVMLELDKVRRVDMIG
jgi:hypothetical protein